MPAFEPTRQEQRRHVGAGDQEQQPHRAEQRQQHGPGAPYLLFIERADEDARILVAVWVLRGDLAGDASELAPRRLDGDAGREAADAVEPIVVIAVHPLGAALQRVPQGDPDLGSVAGKPEPLGHDADDGVRHPIESDCPPDDVGIAVERFPPEVLAHHGDGGGARPVLVGGQPPPEDGGDAQGGKDPGGRERPVDRQRLAAARQGEVVPEEQPHRRQTPRPRLPVEEIRQRDRRRPAFVSLAQKDHAGLVVGIGEGRQQHAIHHREHRRGAPDPHRQREHDREAESRRAPHLPKRIADVVHDAWSCKRHSSQMTLARSPIRPVMGRRVPISEC